MITNRIKTIVFILFFLTSVLSAQGKVEGNALRLRGGLFLGSFKTDIEKRTTFADYFGAQINQDWKGTGGLSLINQLGADYYHSLGSGLLANAFVGLHLNAFGRNNEWRSIYPAGIGIKDGRSGLGFSDINLGVTLNVLPNFRILPKYVLRTMSQNFDGTYLGAGNPVFYGTQNVATRAMSGLLGASFEYDLNADVTLFADMLVFGPFLFRTKGEYNSEMITISNGAVGYAFSNGGYVFSSQKLSLGGSYKIGQNLRLFASLDQERIQTKGESPLSFVIGSNGVSEIATLGQYLSTTNEERIKISGIKFGVTYDIGM